MRRRTVLRIATGALFLLITISVLQKARALLSRSMLDQDEYCLVSHGKYNGQVYKSLDASSRGGGATLSNRCLVQSRWMRLAQHAVQLPGSDTIIDDWLWIDYHDRINVLVEAPKTQTDQGVSFLIIEQTKYALDSVISLAVVGGIIEPTTQIDDNGIKTQVVMPEAPLMAAQREVEEEMGVICNTWVPLGKFRTDVNRGLGWVNPFLARDCSYTTKLEFVEEGETNIVGGADTEQQKMITMELKEVRDAVMKGRFLEVQWSNTVALGILQY
ncbi:hypothetical protein ACHAWO_004213 [Cyclotella atomus]|jgi:hypothetical protein|uniref:Nudix hydrolase domain-containing protein n=1 Tax=Cyclotella atomus TaxID=382360 RepID=A0ABD3QYR1_9STRA